MPKRKQLPNKPLVEAILELQWLVSPEQGDPHYALFLGRLYNSFAPLYPFHEPLPTSMIPQPVIKNVVQHRFRTKENGWPLIQVGPGVVTLNDTDGYIWEDFGRRSKELIQNIYQTYPKPQELKITSLLLRYIDAIEFDSATNDIFDFLKDKLKTQIMLPPKLFKKASVSKMPTGFNFQTVFSISVPKGSIAVKFASGTHHDKPALIWEIAVRSQEIDLPTMPGGFGKWIESAHRFTDDWFFNLIEGELERRFSGEK